MKDDRLAQLAGLSRLILDLRQNALRQAIEAREKTSTQLTELEVSALDEGNSPISTRQVAVRYEVWADARRRELNIMLARQTAQILVTQDEAQKALGRMQALEQVRKKLI